MKHKIKSLYERILWRSGGFIGRGLRIAPYSSSIYRAIVRWNRNRSDTIVLRLHPALRSLGNALYDSRQTTEEMSLINGPSLLLDIGEKTQRQIYSDKLFENGMSLFFLRSLRPGDTVFDIGANVGYYSLLSAAAIGNSGRVIAIEPERRNFEALVRNIEMNGFSHIVPMQCALGDASCNAVLHINPLNRGGNSLLPFEEYATEGNRYSQEAIHARFSESELFQNVAMRTLDELLEREHISSIRIAKIDVEGFEGSVLKGATQALHNQIIEFCICEVNNGQTRSEVFELMRASGYAPFRILYNGSIEPITQDVADLSGNVLFSRYEV